MSATAPFDYDPTTTNQRRMSKIETAMVTYNFGATANRLPGCTDLVETKHGLWFTSQEEPMFVAWAALRSITEINK